MTCVLRPASGCVEKAALSLAPGWGPSLALEWHGWVWYIFFYPFWSKIVLAFHPGVGRGGWELLQEISLGSKIFFSSVKIQEAFEPGLGMEIPRAVFQKAPCREAGTKSGGEFTQRATGESQAEHKSVFGTKAAENVRRASGSLQGMCGNMRGCGILSTFPFFETKCREFVGRVGNGRVEADVRETSPFAFWDFYLKMTRCLLFRCLFFL